MLFPVSFHSRWLCSKTDKRSILIRKRVPVTWYTSGCILLQLIFPEVWLCSDGDYSPLADFSLLIVLYTGIKNQLQSSLGSNLVCSATWLNTQRRSELSVHPGPITAPPSGKWWSKLKSASKPSTLAPSVVEPRCRDKLWGSGTGSCVQIAASDAWTYETASAITVKSAVRRLKELKDQ